MELRVIDTGIGIEEADQARVFEDFVTLDTSYNREVEGTGLGLGIVRRVVAVMRGEIGVESTPGEGSVFWLRVPLPPATTSRARPAESRLHTTPSGTGLSVLVIEDNEINRLVAREMLTDLGAKVAEATDGSAGVEAAGRDAFDLILMDISMPRLDGVEATRRIREGTGPNRVTPIVALTAHVLP